MSFCILSKNVILNTVISKCHSDDCHSTVILTNAIVSDVAAPYYSDVEFDPSEADTINPLP